MSKIHAYRHTRPVENAYLVRARDRRRLRELAAIAVACVLLGSSLLAYTWVNVEAQKIGLRVAELQTKLYQLDEEERRLRLEVAHLIRPERLEERARSELGMGFPSVDQVLFLEDLVP